MRRASRAVALARVSLGMRRVQLPLYVLYAQGVTRSGTW
jgi:hypothetical protein